MRTIKIYRKIFFPNGEIKCKINHYIKLWKKWKIIHNEKFRKLHQKTKNEKKKKIKWWKQRQAKKLRIELYNKKMIIILKEDMKLK